MDRDTNRRVFASISLRALDDNFAVMKQNLKPDTKFCAVVKTDAYGHGAVGIARHLSLREDLWGFAVATMEEALSLREAGIARPILILGYVFPEHYEEAVRQEIRLAVFTREMGEQISQAAQKTGRPAQIHFAVDTGMSRIGFPATEEGAAEAAAVASLDGIGTEGLFTHFARADEADKSTARDAFARYQAFSKLLMQRGVSIPIHHCANSAAILELPETQLTMVRAGITMYGVYPSGEMDRTKNVLTPVMSLASHIAHLKTVPAGTPVSYGGSFVTNRETRIATIPVGYGDGYPRSLSNRGEVLIGGRRAPILGRVCMDQFMVDVTDIPAALHQKVTLLGKDGEDAITLEELDRLSGRFPYEFVCDIGKRVPRILTQD